MTHAAPSLDFGYPWWLAYGHLAVFAPALAFLLLARWRNWSKWLVIPMAVLAVWAAAGFLIMRFAVNVNGRGELPTQSFLSSGRGRVVDLGAGTGRSSIMLLEARPQATLVALDQFGRSYEVHFGAGESPQERLLANLRAAGVEDRATIETGDMRELPFEDASFDAAITCYAVDHLGREGAKKALAEAARVVKPGGDFLMMILWNDVWAKLAFGPVLAHGTWDASWWSGRVEEAGFTIVEQGMPPATLYILARRR